MLETKLPRILIVDDNPAIHEDFKAALVVQATSINVAETKAKLFGNIFKKPEEIENSSQFIIDSAYQGQEALEMVKNAINSGSPYSLAFIDIRMPPGWDGIETIKQLWKVDPEIEIVICSAHSDYSWEEIGKQLNMTDNVIILKKPFEIIEIRQLASTQTMKWKLKKKVKKQILNLQSMSRELLYQATHDSLTGLPNRILLDDRLKQAILQAKRFNLKVAVLLLDLDNFKEVNDSLGHNSGDLLLQGMANKLKASLRESDTVTRLGGDEFSIILSSQASHENITMQVMKLLEIIAIPDMIEDHELIVTASIGISIYPNDGLDTQTLLKNADAALYHAKELGRNTFQYYQVEYNQKMLQRLEMTTALRQAIEKNQLSLSYQPLVDLATNKILGMEALLRWEHPTFGQVAPEIFIPIAEEAGLITSIGEWVLRQACLQNKSWHQSGHPHLRIAVVISVKQFHSKNFVQLIETILNEVNLSPQFLELEITESIILDNITESIEKMTALKKLGVYLAIDDFGTGYSSLSYLKYFQFDKIKIDKSFIDGMLLNNSDGTIVEAIIAMTKQLGLTVLAEGVEKKEQIDFLRDHHSDQVQGYYFSPALTKEASTEFLESHNLEKEKETVS